ncbi:uncharacterized protein CELE_R105.1 [Caenorhabditis elegans]|uniref:Secreted protein n=1 Tax=Caenorhabditis elegans TaxID=6239 RepID=Q21897_CAEEL|nr:Secreted protein [Caenorhabditis elegans]CCD69723.2 Secreted protein [Caenorhabditis elegans]|eukprot:NP_500601.3 Uncharacterized protein CELE_R105.1 [Caenorhabditis elegans]
MHLLIVLLIFTVFFADVYGAIQTWEKEFACPEGLVINGYQVKSQTKQGWFTYDYGVTDMVFFCNTPDGKNQNTDKNITRGNFYPYDNDIWRKIQWCPTGTVVIGMANKLDFGKFDNAGITDICSYCGRPEDDRTKKTYSAWEDLNTHGSWARDQMCDVGSALASFYPKIFKPQAIQYITYGCRKV